MISPRLSYAADLLYYCSVNRKKNIKTNDQIKGMICIIIAAMGFLFLNEVPVLLSVIGYVIIIGIAIIRWHTAIKKQ